MKSDDRQLVRSILGKLTLVNAPSGVESEVNRSSEHRTGEFIPRFLLSPCEVFYCFEEIKYLRAKNEKRRWLPVPKGRCLRFMLFHAPPLQLTRHDAGFHRRR